MIQRNIGNCCAALASCAIWFSGQLALAEPPRIPISDSSAPPADFIKVGPAILIGPAPIVESTARAVDETPRPDAPAADPFSDPPKEPPSRKPPIKQPADKQPADKAASKKDDSAKPAVSPAAKAPAETDIVRFFMNDGSVITGKLSIKDLMVDTDFGQLKVPVTKLRSFTPGLGSFPELSDKVTVLIENLASNDFKLRETAEKELLKLGAKVRVLLRDHVGDANAERATRVKNILAKLDEMAGDEVNDDEEGQPTKNVWIRGDTVETVDFTVVGKIASPTFAIASKYGPLTVKLSEIKNAKLDVEVFEGEVRKGLSVPGQNLVQRGYKSAQVRLEKGDRVNVRASGQIIMTLGNGQISTPDGSTNFSYLQLDGQQFPGGQLVAKVGDDGKAFKVGSSATFTADRAGVLQFAIIMHQSYATESYFFPGEYKLRIKVTRGNEGSPAAGKTDSTGVEKEPTPSDTVPAPKIDRKEE